MAKADDKLASQVLTLPQAADRFKVNRRTLNYAVKAGHLPAERIGNAWVVRPADVGAWIARGKHIPTRAPKRRREQSFRMPGADSWADADANAMVDGIYRARQEGSRPADRLVPDNQTDNQRGSCA